MLPFFEFFTIVFYFYDIFHLHLNPHAILMLSILARLCENFVRVELCLDLFRFFYTTRSMTGPATGSCRFHLRDGAADSYIEVDLKSLWSGWREDWFYLATNDSLDNLRMSSTQV